MSQLSDYLTAQPYDYQSYCVRLRRPLLWVLPGRLWGRWIKWTGPYVFTRDELVTRFGETWEVECQLAAWNNRYQIEGKFEGEAWEPVSQWRLDEKRHAEDIAQLLAGYARLRQSDAVPETADEAALRLSVQMSAMNGRKPGLGELVHHLEAHEKQPPGFASDVARLLVQRGWAQLGDADSLKDWTPLFDAAEKNGRRREDVERKPCRFDEASISRT